MWPFSLFSKKKQKPYAEVTKIMDEKSLKFQQAFEQVTLDIEKRIENDSHIKASSKALKEWQKSVDDSINALYETQKKQDEASKRNKE
jgi:hypothetical protein